MKRLRDLIQREQIHTGGSAFDEVEKMLRIAFYKSLLLIIEDCLALLKDFQKGNISIADLEVQYGIIKPENFDRNKLELEIRNLNKIKKETEKQLHLLKPQPIVKQVSELIVSKFKKKPDAEVFFDNELKSLLSDFDLNLLQSSKAEQIKASKSLQLSDSRPPISIPLELEPDSISRQIINGIAYKKNKFAFYGSSFFSYQLKNNPALMNLIQTQFLYSIRSDLKEIKGLITIKDRVVDLTGIQDYVAKINRKFREKTIHDYDVFAIPITLKPGNIKFIGESMLHRIRERCVVIHGRPACGKTTLIRRIMASITVDSYYIPIEIPLSENIDFLNIRETIKRLLKIRNDESFKALEDTGRLLIIFDALNEVHDIYQTSIKLSFLVEQFENSRFLVTSRTHELNHEASLSAFKPYEIQPLSLDDQIEFIETHTENTEKRNELIAIFHENKHLRSICSNQMIFLMSTRLLEKGRLSSNQISEFYTKFLRWSLIDWEKRDGIERIKCVLENLAYKIVRSSSSKTYLDKSEIDSLWTLDPKICEHSEFKFLLKSGFVENTIHGYRIFQETFQEYLLASWLVSYGIFPIHLTEISPGKWQYRDEFELSELILKFYCELSGISDFNLNLISKEGPIMDSAL